MDKETFGLRLRYILWRCRPCAIEEYVLTYEMMDVPTHFAVHVHATHDSAQTHTQTHIYTNTPRHARACVPEGLKDDKLVHTVHKLWTEVLADLERHMHVKHLV